MSYDDGREGRDWYIASSDDVRRPTSSRMDSGGGVDRDVDMRRGSESQGTRSSPTRLTAAPVARACDVSMALDLDESLRC